jgi:hypothetical protein
VIVGQAAIGEHRSMTSPRRLTFVVGTSLLTASIATGCKSQPTVNPGPEPPHVNTAVPAEAPADETAPDETAPDEPEPEEPNVNTVAPGK